MYASSCIIAVFTWVVSIRKAVSNDQYLQGSTPIVLYTAFISMTCKSLVIVDIYQRYISFYVTEKFIINLLKLTVVNHRIQLFVRLFVDENLDRIIPISKQPKEKVQAILEACDRQFPEFHDRARKRIRTYLKSCRRMRRCKEGSGLEQVIDKSRCVYI